MFDGGNFEWENRWKGNGMDPPPPLFSSLVQPSVSVFHATEQKTITHVFHMMSTLVQKLSALSAHHPPIPWLSFFSFLVLSHPQSYPEMAKCFNSTVREEASEG